MVLEPVGKVKPIDHGTTFAFVVGQPLELECAVFGSRTLEFELLWSCEPLETVSRKATSESCERLLQGNISKTVIVSPIRTLLAIIISVNKDSSVRANKYSNAQFRNSIMRAE